MENNLENLNMVNEVVPSAKGTTSIKETFSQNNWVTEKDKKKIERLQEEGDPSVLGFGGTSYQAPKGVGQLGPGTVLPVPMTNQALYSEDYMTDLSMAKPGYLSILAKRYQERPARISTGIPDLDYVTGGGWVNNGISILCAAPNVGKTTILLQSALEMSQQGTAVVYITNDMRKMDLEAKIISQISYSIKGEDCLSLSDITNENALTKEDDEHVKQIAEKLSTLKYLHIRDLISDTDFDTACENDLTLQGMSKLERVISQYTAVYKNVIFMVDSLQQIAGYLGGGKEGVDNLLLLFKKVSAKAPVVLISTLNRGGYSKTGDIEFTDLKESGSIEYNSDLIITMVPKFYIVKEKDTTLADFKRATKRDIMITCKKSRDSAERDKAMTLVTRGCTFIPYIEDNPVTTSYPSSNTGYKRASKGGNSSKVVNMPPPDALDWGVI